MIGKVIIGASFKNCIAYCLSDKHSLSREEKLLLSAQENVQHHNRAEVLAYNLCYGNAKELAKDFDEVSRLSRRVEKPVLHITLRLAPGDRSLSKNDLADISRKCAEAFDISDHQFLAVLHKDTRQQHIHLVANRVGLDGKVASSSNNYRRMSDFCRRMEKEYHLTEVLSPRKFLPAKERLLPRKDTRKEQLRMAIVGLMKGNIDNYGQFERQMQLLGYRVEKGRGICFIDDRNVRIKGSEIGFSLMKIEKILSLKSDIRDRERLAGHSYNEPEINRWQPRNEASRESAFGKEDAVLETLKEELMHTLHQILRSEGPIMYGTTLPPKKKRKRRRRL